VRPLYVITLCWNLKVEIFLGEQGKECFRVFQYKMLLFAQKSQQNSDLNFSWCYLIKCNMIMYCSLGINGNKLAVLAIKDL
jgi:hypothetical protein